MVKLVKCIVRITSEHPQKAISPMFETEYVEPFTEANKLLQKLAMFYMLECKTKR